MSQSEKKKNIQPHNRLAAWGIPIALVLFFLAIRLPGLGTFVTTDEALWLRRSANFYFAVSHGDWPNTYQSEHPGVVAQWAGAAGFWWKFPSYEKVGGEANSDFQLRRLMLNRGINPMEVLAAGRMILVLIHAAAFAAAWPFARRLLGVPATAVGMGLIALDPFLIAHQRLLHQDGLLASFMLLAVLAYADYLRSWKRTSLIVAGIAAGLSWLTKTPAWALLPVIGLMTLWEIWQTRKENNSRLTARLIGLSIWVGIGLLVLFALYPAMWSAPIEILKGMAGYALGTAEGEYGGPIFFNGIIYPDGDLGAAGWIFYAVSFLWRSTPLTVLGLVAAICVVWKKEKDWKDEQLAIGWLVLFAIAFVLLMTLAEKKFDRYLLPAHAPLILVAGWGLATIAHRVSWLRKPAWKASALLIAVLALQLASALPTFPYYLSYYNPFQGGAAKAPEVLMVGWGEGLDKAASYLNAQQDIAEMEVASWYSSSFNLMFTGEVGDIPIALQLSDAELQDLLSRDYLVIYIHQWQRNTPGNLLEALSAIEPSYRVWIDGLEYVRVYHLNGNDN